MSTPTTTSKPPTSLTVRLVGAWTFVGIPLTYGIVQTVRRAAALFS